jgi:hypothetical protein
MAQLPVQHLCFDGRDLSGVFSHIFLEIPSLRERGSAGT